MTVIVKTEITITKGFGAWQKMVVSQTDKLKEMGISFLYAGTGEENPTKLHTAMCFDSLDAFKKFGADEELTNQRREAGVKIETGEYTIISSDFITNYPTPPKI